MTIGSAELSLAGPILDAVAKELDSAIAHHGPMVSRHEAYAVILEELDEFWDEVKLNPAKMSDGEQIAWQRRMRKELIQTAAMAVRAIVDLDLNAQAEALNPKGPTHF